MFTFFPRLYRDYGSGTANCYLFSLFQGTGSTTASSSDSEYTSVYHPGSTLVTDKFAALSLPRPQRTTPSLVEVPPTPRTQLLMSQLKQQTYEMMNKMQQTNQEQIKDLSTQLQTGLQAFLQQSMEQMMNRLTRP